MNAGPAQLPIPGLLWGQYPERRPESASLLAGWAGNPTLACRVIRVSCARSKPCNPRCFDCQPNSAQPKTKAKRRRLGRRGMTDELQAVAFALFSELAPGDRTAPYPTQFLAARAMLGRRLVEMATGEGKTLAAALAAATAAPRECRCISSPPMNTSRGAMPTACACSSPRSGCRSAL